MDNLQHYQPLSQALNPVIGPTSAPYDADPPREEEEEEEPEPSPEKPNGDAGSPSPRAANSAATDSSELQIVQHVPQHWQQGETAKRRPGRPRGSKTKKRHNQPPPPPAQTHQLPEVTPQNQKYYEFQWRILNLCAEFYGAAEELVKSTPPLVLAQCYHMGPAAKVDPLVILNDAKSVCDSLLANPSRLITNPPPPMYPVVPMFYQSPPQGPMAPPPPIGTTPQSFVVPLNSNTSAPPQPYPYAQPYTPGQYSTPYYTSYQHPANAPQYYPQPAASVSTSAPASAPASAPPASTTVAPTSSVSAGVTVPWTLEEIDRLKKLAEENKSENTGSVDWESVANQWGDSRSKHMIMIKATSLGLKESSGRGTKRRRLSDAGEKAASPSAGGADVEPSPHTHTDDPVPPHASPAQSHTSASASVTPQLAYHAPAPVSTTQQSASDTTAAAASPTASPQRSKLPWPMPTVAADTDPLAGIASTSPAGGSSGEAQRSSTFYRPRPQAESSSPSTASYSKDTANTGTSAAVAYGSDSAYGKSGASSSSSSAAYHDSGSSSYRPSESYPSSSYRETDSYGGSSSSYRGSYSSSSKPGHASGPIHSFMYRP
ncbi:hypothetical protein FISHEDRAFT_58887 [Fistulina hepatica ATCC 64428]|uniref:Uncharacterized protein n=1 Tax=Fistulina hepatica ATCC 64428 TaxID=1128425 RepID=A0A0D7ADW4_9AGAR|nr:hypothetical protein FISHEDRAFT_58887 [Fistulina hepatica ATCC 64428]